MADILPPPTPEDTSPCADCGAEFDTAIHHTMCIAPLDQLDGGVA